MVDVGLADLPVTAKVFENFLQLVTQLRKHGSIILRTSGKIVSARRQNQHARRVRYPTSSAQGLGTSMLPPRLRRSRMSNALRFFCPRISRSGSRCKISRAIFG